MTTNYGGRPGLALRNKRTCGVKIMVRPDEHDALRELADHWQVPLGHAAWGLLSDLLSKLRADARESSQPLARIASRYLTDRGTDA
jgi:hypothetical protein